MSMSRDELRQEIQEALDEAAPLLDRLVELCRKDSYLNAYVPGNLWAERYGYTGKAALDIVEDWLARNTVPDEVWCIECDSTLVEVDRENNVIVCKNPECGIETDIDVFNDLTGGK